MEASDSDTTALIIPVESDVIEPTNVSVGLLETSKWKIIGGFVNTIVQTLIGITVFVVLCFGFKFPTFSTFQLHIVLCTVGYQFLMSHAILCLSGHHWTWLTFRNRRRLHWVLQISGSALAIAGSIIMMLEKKENYFTTTHGKLALAALVFTCVSLINGTQSLYSIELRRWIPTKLSKISHIILGTTAFTLSSACLAVAFNKGSFIKWTSQEFTYLMIGITSLYSLLIVFVPCFTFCRLILRSTYR